jgi:hypothetical protein
MGFGATMAKASEISIRDGVPTDAEAISRGIIQALRDTHSKDYSPAVIDVVGVSDGS